MQKGFIITILFAFPLLMRAQDSVTVRYKVNDESSSPLENVTIATHVLFIGKTNSNGELIRKFARKKVPFSHYFRKHGFVQGHEYLTDTEIGNKKWVEVNITLRTRNNAFLSSQFDSTVIGSTLESVIYKNDIDYSEIHITQEPLGIARCISFETSDSARIYLQIARHSVIDTDNAYNAIKNDKIIGVGFAFPNCKSTGYGEGFVISIPLYNPYCRE